MKNAHLQVKAGSLVKYPPKTGPRTAAAPAVAPHIPKATLRALPAKVVVRVDRVAGKAAVAPKPCSTRPRVERNNARENPAPMDAAIYTGVPGKHVRVAQQPT